MFWGSCFFRRCRLLSANTRCRRVGEQSGDWRAGKTAVAKKIREVKDIC